jgi:peptide/nickel transport system substrate-binding protein
MRRRIIVLTLIAGVLLASCAPQPVPVSTSTPSPTSDAPEHAPQIRFALIGQPQDVNVWQLFDESGASYVNYALRFEYWPRLYHLVPPEFNFQPLAADGMPSEVIQAGDEYSATVKLRADLQWTDASAFTAEDVAFTVNTSLKYELAHDWGAYYSREFLDRAEAVDPRTVKFYFKQRPNIKAWQYGALQGPIVQKAFWETRISAAEALLPDQQTSADVEFAGAYLANVQTRVDELNAQINDLFLKGQENRELSGELVKRQGELGYATNTLNDLLNERAAEIESAQQALYQVDDDGEPTLGAWMPAGEENGIWTNEANPYHPFVQPNFDKAIYMEYEDGKSAYSAFTKGEVDVILNADGMPQESSALSRTNSVRFLVFNPAHIVLSDVQLRNALACMINVEAQGMLQADFVLSNFWKNNEAALPCNGLSDEQRMERAVELLKNAGYTWGVEPAIAQAGSGMKLPDGTAFPRLGLLSVLPEVDGGRAELAGYIEQQALHLGIPMDVQLTDLASLHYSVYSSGKYDLAIFGWRLSDYPAYLCEWFGPGALFENNSDRFGSTCEALAVESDLEMARSRVFEVQSILLEELPFVPLYPETAYEAFQNVEYPFESVQGGLRVLYGAPSYAMPAK